MSARVSEVILVVVLLVLTGFSRVYYGGAASPMVVWKSEFGFKDTVVNLSDFLSLSNDERVAEHPNVLSQLEDMGLVDHALQANTTKRKQPVDRHGVVHLKSSNIAPMTNASNGQTSDPAGAVESPASEKFSESAGKH